MVVQENGYVEDSFLQAGAASAEALAVVELPDVAGLPTLLLHNGIVYPSERDPAPLFVALGQLCGAGMLGPSDLKIRFRAAVHEDLLRNLAARHGVQELIDICSPIDYCDALQEMLGADALLVMQASNCNQQIRAKLYEYCRFDVQRI